MHQNTAFIRQEDGMVFPSTKVRSSSKGRWTSTDGGCQELLRMCTRLEMGPCPLYIALFWHAKNASGPSRAEDLQWTCGEDRDLSCIASGSSTAVHESRLRSGLHHVLSPEQLIGRDRSQNEKWAGAVNINHSAQRACFWDSPHLNFLTLGWLP